MAAKTAWPSPRPTLGLSCTYAHRIVENASALGEAFVRQGLKVLTGGTENHLLVLDVASTHGITGRQAEDAVRKCGITLNRNPIPFDPNGPWYTSGLRSEPSAVTTACEWWHGTEDERNRCSGRAWCARKHIKPSELTRSGAIDKTKYTLDEAIRSQAHTRSSELLNSFPLYPEIDLPFLAGYFGLN